MADVRPDADPELRGEVTMLLEDVRGGREEALDRLVALVYEELRRTAKGLMRRERQAHTFGATDLVHEAYLRMFDQDQLNWRDRGHFYGSAAVAMRRALVDHARRRLAGKRIPKDVLVPLELAGEPASLPDHELIALDTALERLAEVQPRQARIVELRFFAGLTESEVAEALELSRMTVSREWRVAKLWLHREMVR